jgi:hypothetical protein
VIYFGVINNKDHLSIVDTLKEGRSTILPRETSQLLYWFEIVWNHCDGVEGLVPVLQHLVRSAC